MGLAKNGITTTASLRRPNVGLVVCNCCRQPPASGLLITSGAPHEAVCEPCASATPRHVVPTKNRYGASVHPELAINDSGKGPDHDR